MSKLIYGAGISGLLAGSIFQDAKIFEAGPENQVQHKAVLRFKTDAVGKATGIDFRKVKVNKGIWCDEKFAEPNILLANNYSQKVIGRLADRSIWNLAPVERFIAPEDFVELLSERCAGRVEWNHELTAEEIRDNSLFPAISTLPMPLMKKFLHDQCGAVSFYEPEFEYASITVRRWKIRDADVFQTIYFPSPETSLYRASITGDLLIAEYAGGADDYPFWAAFGLSYGDLDPVDMTSQRYGKIAPIDDGWRKKFIFDLTSQHNIFSVGRFAIWKNVLVDDVLNDIWVVKKLIGTSHYERAKHNSK